MSLEHSLARALAGIKSGLDTAANESGFEPGITQVRVEVETAPDIWGEKAKLIFETVVVSKYFLIEEPDAACDGPSSKRVRGHRKGK